MTRFFEQFGIEIGVFSFAVMLAIALAWIILPFVMIVMGGRMRDLLKQQKQSHAELVKLNAALRDLLAKESAAEGHLRHMAVFQKAASKGRAAVAKTQDE